MRIITRKRLNEFGKNHPDVKTALDSWYSIVKKTNYKSFNELKKTFPTVDKVKNLFIFNIGGNKVRLISSIHFSSGIIFIRQILTHAEYDKGNWKKDLK